MLTAGTQGVDDGPCSWRTQSTRRGRHRRSRRGSPGRRSPVQGDGVDQHHDRVLRRRLDDRAVDGGRGVGAGGEQADSASGTCRSCSRLRRPHGVHRRSRASVPCCSATASRAQSLARACSRKWTSPSPSVRARTRVRAAAGRGGRPRLLPSRCDLVAPWRRPDQLAVMTVGGHRQQLGLGGGVHGDGAGDLGGSRPATPTGGRACRGRRHRLELGGLCRAAPCDLYRAPSARRSSRPWCESWCLPGGGDLTRRAVRALAAVIWALDHGEAGQGVGGLGGRLEVGHSVGAERIEQLALSSIATRSRSENCCSTTP